MSIVINPISKSLLLDQPGGVAEPQALGTIFTETAWAAFSPKFTVLGSSSITVSGGKVLMSGGNATFNDKIHFTDASNPHRYTCLEKWKQRVKAKVPTRNGTSYGIGIGVDSAAAEEYSTSIRWTWDTTGNGRAYLYTKRTISGQIDSGALLTPSSGTTYVIQLERNKNVFILTIFAENGTTQLATYTYTLSLTSGATIQPHNTGRFCIQNFGGTDIEILEWTVESEARKYIDYAGVGDSNMAGLFATSTSNRYFEQAMTAKNKTFEILAGIADRSGDVLLRVPEMIAMSPRSAYINLLSNDIANGVASGTYQSNYNSIVSQLEAANIIVKLGTPVARSTNLTAAQTFINAKANAKIDLFARTKNSGNTSMQATFNSGDNIHMNLAGNNACADELETII